MEPYDKTCSTFERADFENATRIIVDSSGNIYEKRVVELFARRKGG
jgi:hypothetical protein